MRATHSAKGATARPHIRAVCDNSIAKALINRQFPSRIRLVFVNGNNQAASHIRKELKKEKQKGCLREALKAEDADAVLEIDSDSEAESGPFAVRQWIVSGKLHSKSGEVLWSESERLEDAPLSSGGKTAAKVLLGHLQEQVCDK